MPVPSVTIKKVDYQTGSAAPSPVGVLAIIASASSGPVNAPSSYASDAQAFSDYGPSPLSEDTSYTLAVAGVPPIPIRPTTSVAAAYGTITTSFAGGSTSVPSAGTTHPVDYYNVIIQFPTGGTIGTTGIVWQYSLDGGNTFSGPQNLGTSTTITIPNFAPSGSPGVSFSMGAGTVTTGDFFTCPTTPPLANDSDLTASLEALRVSTLPWEGVLIDFPMDGSTPGQVDTWLAGLEKVGKFRFAILQTPMKGSQTEAAYLTAEQTLVSAATPSIRMCVCADGGYLVSNLTGLKQVRTTALALGADAMSIPIGQDPAWVGAGAITGYVITDSKGNPLFHNEELYPNLDQLQLTTFRSVNGSTGVYFNNAKVFSTVGSDYVFLPHIRTMNRACETAYAALTKALGQGVGKKPKNPDGTVNILESDASKIEQGVQNAVAKQVVGQVSALQFKLSRSDDISANSGATINGTLSIVALAYIKGIAVIAAFQKSISVSP
ncbi:MAG TPA: DUF2586 family protein [Gaiellaceae bacterium]|nr:DUF2586 family protein [Gaiellaceae bacterium]